MMLVKNNWFWPVMLGLWALAWLTAGRMEVTLPSNWEYALLFDVFVTAPVLYWLCYRDSLTTKTMLVRMVALQCLGIWIATKVMPLDQQRILPELGILRIAGIAVLFVIELRLVLTLVRAVFRQGATQQDLVAQGAPEFIAKMALIEARFWRWAFGLFKR
jgi:uncharacterized membrane protein